MISQEPFENLDKKYCVPLPEEIKQKLDASFQDYKNVNVFAFCLFEYIQLQLIGPDYSENDPEAMWVLVLVN